MRFQSDYFVLTKQRLSIPFHFNSYLQMFMHFVSLFCTLSHLERAETVLGLSVPDFLLSFARFTLEKVTSLYQARPG